MLTWNWPTSQRAWVALRALATHADKDGIVCMPPVGRRKGLPPIAC
jgi:hypothetical protein